MDMNNSGSTAGKVMTYPDNLTSPRDYKAPATDSAQTQGTVNKTFMLSEEQTFNNMSQGTGIAGPAVWGSSSEGDGAKSTAGAGTKQSDAYNVSLVDGQHNCWNGGEPR